MQLECVILRVRNIKKIWDYLDENEGCSNLHCNNFGFRNSFYSGKKTPKF